MCVCLCVIRKDIFFFGYIYSYFSDDNNNDDKFIEY